MAQQGAGKVERVPHLRARPDRSACSTFILRLTRACLGRHIALLGSIRKHFGPPSRSHCTTRLAGHAAQSALPFVALLWQPRHCWPLKTPPPAESKRPSTRILNPSGKLPSSTCCTGRQLARILHVAWLRAQVGHQILRIYPGAMEDHELAVPSLCYLPRTGAQFTYAGTPEYRIFINGPCAKLL